MKHLVRLLCLACALLSGCSMTRLIDSDVQSFASGPRIALPASYRFDRLPSQQSLPEQAQWEAAAAQALEERGLHRDDAAPQYSAELSVQWQKSAETVDPPLGAGHWMNRGPFLWSPAWPPRFWYRHTLHLSLRDLTSHQVVYETMARYEGPWPDSKHLIPALLQAALQDFPNSPPGPRRVNITLPADGSAPQP